MNHDFIEGPEHPFGCQARCPCGIGLRRSAGPRGGIRIEVIDATGETLSEGNAGSVRVGECIRDSGAAATRKGAAIPRYKPPTYEKTETHKQLLKALERAVAREGLGSFGLMRLECSQYQGPASGAAGGVVKKWPDEGIVFDAHLIWSGGQPVGLPVKLRATRKRVDGRTEIEIAAVSIARRLGGPTQLLDIPDCCSFEADNGLRMMKQRSLTNGKIECRMMHPGFETYSMGPGAAPLVVELDPKLMVRMHLREEVTP